MDKVIICHSTPGTTVTLTVNQAETPIHLSHGDMLGACATRSGAITKSPALAETTNGVFVINVMPNPSAKNFTLNVTTDVGSPMTLRIIDISGKVIERKNLTAGQSLRIGDGYRPGMYLAEISQGNERKILKLVKIQ